MRTDYRIDDFQQLYFVIDSFESLLEATQQDFGPIYQRLANDNKVHGLTDLIDSDTVLTKGTQAYAIARAG